MFKEVKAMNKIDLSKLVIKKIQRVYTPHTRAGLCEKIESRYTWSVMLKHIGHTYYTTDDGQEYVSDNKHIIITPKGGNYTWHCKADGWVSIIDFEAEIEGYKDGEYGDIISFETDAFSKLLSIQKEMEFAKMGDPLLLHPLQMRCMYDFIRVLLKSEKQQFAPDNHSFKKIRPALEYISKNYLNSKITNDILAAECNISTVYFRKLFTNAYGVSPQICILRLKMENAKEYLKNGEFKNISEVADRVGYNDVYQFSKMFKRYTGISPKKYLCSIRNGEDIEANKP
jgi:AraC-like DNA-binding protein